MRIQCCAHCGTPLDGTVKHTTREVLDGDVLKVECSIMPLGYVGAISGVVRLGPKK